MSRRKPVVARGARTTAAGSIGRRKRIDVGIASADPEKFPLLAAASKAQFEAMYTTTRGKTLYTFRTPAYSGDENVDKLYEHFSELEAALEGEDLSEVPIGRDTTYLEGPMFSDDDSGYIGEYITDIGTVRVPKGYWSEGSSLEEGPVA